MTNKMTDTTTEFLTETKADKITDEMTGKNYRQSK